MPQTGFAEKEEGVRFSFWLEGNEQAEYRIAAFKAEEALFSLTKIEILLKISSPSPSFTDFLGKKAALSIEAEGLAKPTFLSGVVAQVSEFFEAGEVLTRLLLLPSLAALEKEPRCRVFQELTVPDIVETLLCEHGIADALWQLEGSFTPRRFCMQYGETDLAFMQRILAEEGIFYYFVHEAQGRQNLVLCNNIQLLLNCPNGGLKHDSHDSHGLYDVAGAGEVYCHSLRRSCGMGRRPRGQRGKAAGELAGSGSAVLFSPSAAAADGSSLSGIVHLPLPLCGHKLALQCPFDKSLNGVWSLIAARHEGMGEESGGLTRDLAEYFDGDLQADLLDFAENSAVKCSAGRAFGAASLLPRLMQAHGGFDCALRAASPYGVPYKSGAAPNVVSMGSRGGSAPISGARAQDRRKAVYACAFTALDGTAAYQPPRAARPIIAGPQEARLVRVDKAARRYKLALRINEGCEAAADDVRFWVYADTELGAAAAEIAAASGDLQDSAAQAGSAAGSEKFLLEFLGGNPDRPIAPAHKLYAARGAGGRRSAPERGQDMAAPAPADAAEFDEAAFAEQVRNACAGLPDTAGQISGAEAGKALPRQKNAIPLAQIQADLRSGTAPAAAWPRPSGADAGLAEPFVGSRFIQVAEHQREDINGIYELNCGEKYLCRAATAHLNAAEKMILRGPGGRIIIDKYSLILEAPLIRLKGRLIVEEDAFDRQEGVKSAIRDELPLVADCGSARSSAAPKAPAAAAKGSVQKHR